MEHPIEEGDLDDPILESNILGNHLLVMRGKRIGQEHRLRRGTTMLKKLMDLCEAREILGKMVLLTYYTRVLDFALFLVSSMEGCWDC